MSVFTKKSDTHQERYVHLEIKNHDRVHHATVYAREYAAGVWGASVAFCAHGDQFIRRVGRSVARRKYFEAEGKHRWHLGSFSYDRAVNLALTRATDL
jgi:hypothetical protein